MKLNYFYFICIFLISIAVCYRFFIPIKQQTATAKMLKIAILTPAEHPSLEKIEQAFKATFQKNSALSVHFDTFNAHGERVLMGTQARTILQASYDLVFTIGAQASQLIREQINKRKKKIPHVFAAVDNPVGLGLITSLEQPGLLITGVYENPHHQESVNALINFKPSIKKVLLVYNPTQGAGLENQYEQLKKLFEQRSVALIPCQLFNAQEIPTKVGTLITAADAVMILKDNTVVPAVSILTKLCNQHHIPLITSELESGEKGAALSVGVHEEEFGNKGALLALSLLNKEKNSGYIPCQNPGMPEVRINKDEQEQQDIYLKSY